MKVHAQSIREAVEAVRGVWPVELRPGRITRFDDAEGRRKNRACWAWQSPDGSAVVAGNWRAPSFCACYVKGAEGRNLSAVERRAMWQQVHEAQRKAKAQQAAEWAQAAKVAAVIVAAMRQAREVGHAYLARKRVRPVAGLGVIDAGEVRRLYERETGRPGSWLWSRKLQAPMSGPLLVVPCCVGGFSERLSSVELIDGAGAKVCLVGGRMSGACWAPTGLSESVAQCGNVGVAEGIATALTITQWSGVPCVAARSCGNLMPVTQAIRNRFPFAQSVVFGDRGNGEAQARQAAAACGAGLSLPPFSAEQIERFRHRFSSEPTDFNDLFVLEEF